VAEVVRDGSMELEYIPIESMTADGLTKTLPAPVHLKFCEALRLVGMD